LAGQQTVPPPIQQAPLYGIPVSLSPIELADLAARYKKANSTYTWTLIVGLFCFWPLLIATVLEYNKMKEILARISAMGIDAKQWKNPLNKPWGGLADCS